MSSKRTKNVNVQSQKKIQKETEKIDVPYKRPVLFEYPPLPRVEIIFYFIYLIVFLAYGWWRIFELSQRYEWNNPRAKNISYLPFFGNRTKDTSNFEWRNYRPFSLKIIPAYIIHCLIFNFTERLFGERYKHYWELCTTLYSILAGSLIFGFRSILTCIAYGFVIFSVSKLSKSKTLVWLSSISCLWILLRGFYLIPTGRKQDQNFYYMAMLHGYKLLCFISFNIEMITDKIHPQYNTFTKSLFRMYYYAFYLPYTVSVIVIYPEFERQMLERRTKKRQFGNIGFFALRIIFWYIFADFVLHFLYFEAILYDRKTLYTVPLDTLAALGYAVGQFFHLKYAVIFGVPSLFAMVDNMQPADPPICIARINLYSEIWRGFDRGLYAFFKEYIYLAIIRPTFSVQRKLFGVLISYSFVLVWHGLQRNNIVWIVLNVISLLLESVGRGIYTICAVRNWREKYISDQNFRRILAWLQVAPYAFSLFSIVYFLAGSKTGYVFVDRFFWGEVMTLGYPFPFLVLLGYMHSNVCMELKRYYSKPKVD